MSKTRTFTVLITEDYEGREITQEEAVAEMRDAIQDGYDNGEMIGQNFLITEVEDGDHRFWKEWNTAIQNERGQ